MSKTKIIFIIISMLCLNVILFASETQKNKPLTQKEVTEKFISWDKNLNTLDTYYEQETSFEGTVISKTDGHLVKSGKNIRLETLEEGKIIQYALTDKNIINIFDEKGNLVMQMPWNNWQETQQNKALFDFGNYAEILKSHKIVHFETSVNGYLIVLTPKESTHYVLSFLLNKNNFFPKEITLMNEGVQSKTILQKTKINRNIKEEFFK